MALDLAITTSKFDYIENQSQQRNIRTDGIKESSTKSWRATKETVKSSITGQLKLPDFPAVERAHRVGKPTLTSPKSTKPRKVIVQFSSFKDKEKVLEAARKLKDSGNCNRPSHNV